MSTVFRKLRPSISSPDLSPKLPFLAISSHYHLAVLETRTGSAQIRALSILRLTEVFASLCPFTLSAVRLNSGLYVTNKTSLLATHLSLSTPQFQSAQKLSRVPNFPQAKVKPALQFTPKLGPQLSLWGAKFVQLEPQTYFALLPPLLVFAHTSALA